MSAPAQGELRRIVVEFAESRIAAAGMLVLVAIVLLAAFAPWMSPQDPYDLAVLDIMDSRLPPATTSGSGTTFWLGTDDQGRDILSAIFYGLRTSIVVAVTATLLAVVIGMTLGLASGYVGGALDAVLMRIVDIQLSFPAVLIALILLAVLGQGVDKIILALIAVQWAYYARTMRGVALAERNKEYMQAAMCLMLPGWRIVVRHLLPNCLPPLIVVATVQIAYAIALEATLSFLGLGMPITQPSLGLLIANGFNYLLSGKYWLSFFPGVALVLTIVSINLVGDRLRDVLNPRLQR